jgi:hypothetical protein
MTVQKVSSTCCVAKSQFREFEACEEVAQYSATFALSNGKELNMDLCSRHLRNAVRIAEIQAARVYPYEKAKVTSMSFFHLALAGKRRAS